MFVKIFINICLYLIITENNAAISSEVYLILNSTAAKEYFNLNRSEIHNYIGYETPCGIRNVGDSRIVGGSNASPGEFPWQVSVQEVRENSSSHVCGGAIVSSYWIITACHCVCNLKNSSLAIVAGDHDLYEEEGVEQRIYVSRIIRGNFNVRLTFFQNDIALLQLEKPIKLDGIRTAPVCIPQPERKYWGFGTVSGWGKLTENGILPNILQYVTLPILLPDQCKELYNRRGYGQFMNECQFCSGLERGGLDTCQGDSGGPMVCLHPDGKYYLCGIVSWGIGCARPELPGVYTEVSCYSEWIRNVLYNISNLQ